jgi:hypothetical protein
MSDVILGYLRAVPPSARGTRAEGARATAAAD